MTEPAATRPTKGIVVTAVLIAVLGVLIAYDKGRDTRPRASVGDVVSAADTLADAHESFVLLPTGRLDILATDALDDVDRDASARQRQAPDDGSFVGLQITTAPLAPTYPLTLPYTRLDMTLTLVADGRRYPLAGDDEIGSRTSPVPLRKYIAVAGTPSRLALEVGYQTRKQQVDLRSGRHTPGVFAGLYRSSARTVSCGAPVLSPAGTVTTGRAPSCRVEVLLRTPYYRSVLWAPEGREWLVLQVVTESAEGVRYEPPGATAAGYKLRSTGDLTYGWNGGRPAYGAESDDEFGPQQQNVVVVSVPAKGAATGVLTASTAQRAVLREDTRRVVVPEVEQVTTTWRVRL